MSGYMRMCTLTRVHVLNQHFLIIIPLPLLQFFSSSLSGSNLCSPVPVRALPTQSVHIDPPVHVHTILHFHLILMPTISTPCLPTTMSIFPVSISFLSSLFSYFFSKLCTLFRLQLQTKFPRQFPCISL
jgi:hypothetical protein